MSDQDLPLLSNIRDIRARHYLIDLHPNLHNKVIQGKVFIFFEPTTFCENRGGCCTRECLCSDEKTQNSGNITAGLDQERRLNVSGVSIEIPENVTVVETQNSVENNITSAEKDVESQDDFEVVLDCCDIRVKNVSEVSCEEYDLERFLHPRYVRECKFAINFWSGRDQEPLQYTVDPWCIRIRKTGVKSVQGFPPVVCITYETTPQGKSLMWRRDRDGNPCVFTPAAAINNRSLLPCQDPPSAMATWQAWITVNNEFHVSMTGDNHPVQTSAYHRNDFVEEDTSTVCFYYYTTMVLPIATIAIAVGQWETEVIPAIPRTEPDQGLENTEEKTKSFRTYPCRHYEYPCHLRPRHWNSETLLTAVYPPSSKRSVEPLISFIPYALDAAVGLLGTYPCRRLELVILPACFGCLGLASPNLIFLSPTVVLDDPAAYIRLSHEISHAWFGINIGAQDWTEEWLSEGFATYMEDMVYAEAVLARQIADSSSRHQNSRRCPSQRCHRNQQTEKVDTGESRRKLCTGVDISKSVVGNNVSNHEQGDKGESGGVLFVQDRNFVNNSSKCANNSLETLSNQGSSMSFARNMVTLPETRLSQSDKCLGNNLVCSKSGQVSEENDRSVIVSHPTYTRQNLEELSQLRAHLHYRTIVTELQHSTEELQILRPMHGETLEDARGVNYVKNGLNPEKTFLQVHYLKGYFLLKYLSELVGREEFSSMIKEFVTIYHGQLVSSQHVLDLFIKTFPHVLAKGITQDLLYGVWLHQPGLNDEIRETYGAISNDLVSEVERHFDYWIQFDRSKHRSRKVQKKAKIELESFIFSDQLVLFLEYLLELTKLSSRTLRRINVHYDMTAQCGDVRHRWCELVVKHNHEDLAEVERFLLEDQSMGVYLYGELVISRKVRHVRLAKRVFAAVQRDMDENARLTVLSMLYGEETQHTGIVDRKITP